MNVEAAVSRQNAEITGKIAAQGFETKLDAKDRQIAQLMVDAETQRITAKEETQQKVTIAGIELKTYLLWAAAVSILGLLLRIATNGGHI